VKRPPDRIPDTNAIVRYLLADDPAQSPRASEFFARVRGGEQRVLVLEGVIAETIYILTKSYRVPRQQAAAGLQGLLGYRGVVNQDRAALVDALELFARGRLDIVDCILVAKARHGHSEPFSFDDALMKEYRSSGNAKGSAG